MAGKNLYDLLQALVDRTAWRTEEEAREMGALLRRLREMDALGSLTAKITTKTEVHSVEREDVRQLPGDLQRERFRLAAGSGEEHGPGGG